jgi:hypothetical protein
MAEITTVEGQALPGTADAIQRAIDALDKEFKDSACPSLLQPRARPVLNFH